MVSDLSSTSDHEPAHVHIIGDGQAKVNLLGPDGGRPQLVFNVGIKRSDMRRLLDQVTLHRQMLVEEWERIHG